MSPVSLALVKFLRRKSASDAMIKWPLSCIDAYIVNMDIKSNRNDTSTIQKRRLKMSKSKSYGNPSK